MTHSPQLSDGIRAWHGVMHPAVQRCIVLSVAWMGFGALPNEETVLQSSDDGVIDWTHDQLKVIGVGRPTITSPTGAMTPRDTYEMAREDAARRLGSLLARLPVDAHRQLGDVGELADRRARAVEAYTSPDTLRFSDGSVHLPAEIPFGWVRESLPRSSSPSAATSSGAAHAQVPPVPVKSGSGAPIDDDASAAPDAGPTGLILLVQGEVAPAVRIELQNPTGGRSMMAGLRGDRFGFGGVAWVRSRATARAHPLAGDRPVELVVAGATNAGPGVLIPNEPAAPRIFGDGRTAGLDRLPGVVVVMP